MHLILCVLFWTPDDPQTVRLVSLTGHPSFVVRQAATNDLRVRCGVDPIAVRYAVASSYLSPDPEIQRRVRCALAGCERPIFRIVRFPSPVPWIDCLPYNFSDRQELISKFVGASIDAGTGGSKYVPWTKEEWPAYSEATVRWVESQAAACVFVWGYTRGVEALLEEMARNRKFGWVSSRAATKDRPPSYPR